MEAEEDFVEVAPEEAEEALEKVDPEKECPKGTDADADVALEEAAVTQEPSEQDANLPTQEPQASPVEADVDTDAALEVTTTQQNSAQDASLSTQEPRPLLRRPTLHPRILAMTRRMQVYAVALDQKTKSESDKKPESSSFDLGHSRLIKVKARLCMLARARNGA